MDDRFSAATLSSMYFRIYSYAFFSEHPSSDSALYSAMQGRIVRASVFIWLAVLFLSFAISVRSVLSCMSNSAFPLLSPNFSSKNALICFCRLIFTGITSPCISLSFRTPPSSRRASGKEFIIHYTHPPGKKQATLPLSGKRRCFFRALRGKFKPFLAFSSQPSGSVTAPSSSHAYRAGGRTECRSVRRRAAASPGRSGNR